MNDYNNHAPTQAARESQVNITELEAKTREDLMEIAKELGVQGYSGLRKQDLIYRLLQAHS